MTVLLTGATGFLGSELARQLCDRGERVRVLVRPTSDLRRLSGLDVDVAQGDVTDRASVTRALDGVTQVHHVAAMYEIGASDPARMREVNVGGTTNVLEAAAERGIPAVHVSSVSAQGPSPAAPVGEEWWAPEPGDSVYAHTKREAHEVFNRVAGAGASVRAALPVTIYGPDDSSLIGGIMGFLARWPVPVGSFAGSRVSFVHVADCADGLIHIADKGTDGQSYVLSGQVATVSEVLALAARITGRRRPLAYIPVPVVTALIRAVRPLVPLVGLSRALLDETLGMVGTGHWSFTAEKAERELGWRARSLEDGLRETLDWYRTAR